MNYKIKITFIFLILLGLKCKEDISNTQQLENIKEIKTDSQKEIVGLWVPEFNDNGWSIDFTDKENYEEYFSGEGCGGYKGKYSIDIKNNIRLQPNENQKCLNQERLKENLCILKPSPDSLYSDWKIICGKSEFFSLKDEKKDGVVLYVESRKMIAVHPKVFYTKDVIYFREGPGVNFKSISCGVEMAAYDIRRQTLPENTYLIAIARTVEKHKIDNKENYWYYVKPYTGWYSSGCDKKFGWVFGEYIERRNGN